MAAPSTGASPRPAPRPWDRPHPEFAYSESQDRRRRSCARAHILAAHTAHRGWTAPVGTMRWLAYRLKKAQPLAAALGSAVHAAATTCVAELQAGRPLPSFDALHAQALGELTTLWRNSRGRLPEFWRRPADAPVFLEALYAPGPSEVARLRARVKLERVLANLLACDEVWEWVRDAAPEDMILPDPYFRFVLDDDVLPEGVPVYAAADLIVRPRAGGPWIILDWKSGAADGVVDQVLVYALGALHGRGLDILGDGCRGAVVALDAPAEERLVTFAVTAEDLADAEQRVRANIAASRALLVDARENVPLALEDVPGPSKPGTCRWCPYRALCHPTSYTLSGLPTDGSTAS